MSLNWKLSIILVERSVQGYKVNKSRTSALHTVSVRQFAPFLISSNGFRGRWISHPY